MRIRHNVNAVYVFAHAKTIAGMINGMTAKTVSPT